TALVDRRQDFLRLGAKPLLEFAICFLLRDRSFQNTDLEVLAQQDASVGEESAHRVGRLCTLHQPVECAIIVDVDRRRYSQRVVSTQFFNEATITWCPGVSDNDVVNRQFLTASAGQPDFYHFSLRLWISSVFKFGPQR